MGSACTAQSKNLPSGDGKTPQKTFIKAPKQHMNFVSLKDDASSCGPVPVDTSTVASDCNSIRSPVSPHSSVPQPLHTAAAAARGWMKPSGCHFPTDDDNVAGGARACAHPQKLTSDILQMIPDDGSSDVASCNDARSGAPVPGIMKRTASHATGVEANKKASSDTATPDVYAQIPQPPRSQSAKALRLESPGGLSNGLTGSSPAADCGSEIVRQQQKDEEGAWIAQHL